MATVHVDLCDQRYVCGDWIIRCLQKRRDEYGFDLMLSSLKNVSRVSKELGHVAVSLSCLTY